MNFRLVSSVVSALALLTATAAAGLQPARAGDDPTPQWRPQYHFTPLRHWMNDPNGLLYDAGRFNLFYQYNPTGDVAENQVWAHAASPDLLHWQRLGVAIPATVTNGVQSDLIFSGSAVRDTGDTSGFGRGWRAPLVAMYADNYTIDQVLPDGLTVGAGTQTQSIAYSLDDGRTWTKYANNPVIAAPPPEYAGQTMAFRDPKLFWYEPAREWRMVVALSNIHKVAFYALTDLKHWRYLSSFGAVNAQGGAWECPDLFPLRVDDVGVEKWVLMVGINPGGYTAGSADQYIVGRFDGTIFTPDPASIHDTARPSRATPIIDLHAAAPYEAAGWTATGAFAGAGPVPGPYDGAPETGFIDTFLGGDASKGTLTSPIFTITRPYIDFLIGGGYHPYDPQTWHTPADTETAVNLIVDGRVVASTTGNALGSVAWRSWDLRGLLGHRARIEVVDANDGATGWGHLIVGGLVFADQAKQEANWVDYGPDFYAAVTWNGLPDPWRTGIGWMNNWNYAQTIPTSPWRGQNSIPRHFQLRTIDGQIRLVQNPVRNLPELYGPAFTAGIHDDAVDGVSNAGLGGAHGASLDIALDFIPRDAAQFGIVVGAGSDGIGTRIGYDTRTSTLFIDRERSGDVAFSPGFSGIYTAPLSLDRDRHVRMRVLVDRSSVEVFGGVGQSVLSALIFPPDGNDRTALFSSGGTAILHAAFAAPVRDALSDP